MRPECQCSKAEEILKSDIDITERKKNTASWEDL